MSQPLGASHSRVRRLKRLLTKRALRWSEGVYVVEGTELVRLALELGRPLEGIYLDEAQADQVADLAEHAASIGIRVHTLARGVLEKVTDTVTPQPVLAVVPITTTTIDQLAPGLVLVLAEVRDPGNAGTLLRTAEASGCTGVVLAGEAVDPFNPKTVRSSAGTVLWVPLVVDPDLHHALEALSSHGFRPRGTTMTGGTAYDEADWGSSVALVLGNEAHGLDPDTLAKMDDLVSVPMAGAAESLNVGVAGAVLCFEALRQRRHQSGHPEHPIYDEPMTKGHAEGADGN